MKRQGQFLMIFSLLFVFSLFTEAVGADPAVEQTAQTIYQSAKKAMVYIRAFRADGTLKTFGSGFLIRDDGTLITANHVVDKATRFECVSGEPIVARPCSLLSKDKSADAAMLKITQTKTERDPPIEFPFLRLRSSPVFAGEIQYAIGFPLKETLIITQGIVSTPLATVSGNSRMIVSSPVENGMSGGPILDANGQVIGFLSASYRLTSGLQLIIDTAQFQKALGVTN